MSGPAANPESFLSAIVESSSDAIIGKTLDGIVRSWNGAATMIFGYRADEMIGQSIRRLIPDDRQAEEDRILASIRAGERVATFETIRLRADGAEVHLAVTVSPVHDRHGRVIGASKIARDITQARQVERALHESESRFRLMADNISQLAWIADRGGAITWYNRRWYDYTGTTPETMVGWGWRTVHDPDRLPDVEARFRRHIEAGETWEDTFPLKGADGSFRWFLSRAAPLTGPDGQILWWFGTNTDITEQREAEKRIELLMLEVNHRSKNMLAMIQSLARRSVPRGEGGHADFVARLEQRIASLAASQDLLVRRSWSDVPLDELADVQLDFLGEALGQVDRRGPRLDVTPGAAEAIGMALHELATNALKYGALSVTNGTVSLAWRVDRGDLVMCWAEQGGPPISGPPEHRGFGSRLITDVPRGKLGGQVETEFAPNGFRWTMRCPLSAVRG